MESVKDLFSGQKPAPIELFYNGTTDADSVTKRYKGSLVKVANWENANGAFLTWAGDTTAYENIFGILEEEQGITTNYLPNDVTYGMRKRKVTPTSSSTIVRAEYSQNDPAGTTNLATGASGTAAATTLTSGENSSDTYTNIGAWVYFTNGANANYLHYIESHTNASPMVYTLGSALVGAVVAADDFIFILPPMTGYLDLCAHLVTIVSKELVSARTVPVLGLMTYITDVGIPFQPLDRNKHDGLKLKNPRFYHDFLLSGSVTLTNVFTNGIIRA